MASVIRAVDWTRVDLYMDYQVTIAAVEIDDDGEEILDDEGYQIEKELACVEWRKGDPGFLVTALDECPDYLSGPAMISMATDFVDREERDEARNSSISAVA